MIRAIVFDKDGTLLAFDDFWMPVTQAALGRMLDEWGADYSLLPIMMDAIGANEGITGLMYHGTYDKIAAVLGNILHMHGYGITPNGTLVAAAFTESIHYGRIRPICPHLRDVLLDLRARGLILGLVTSDDDTLTDFCLSELNIFDLFDCIRTDNGTCPPKPAPDHMQAFCRQFRLSPDEVLMVGDTMTDLQFALNSGAHPIGVAITPRDSERLAGMAEAVLHDVSDLAALLDDHRSCFSPAAGPHVTA